MLASGAAAAGAQPIREGSEAYEELAYAVHVVCEGLARAIASDGEGASRLVTVTVTGAPTDEDADVARARCGELAAGEDCHRWPRLQLGPHRHGARQVRRCLRPGRCVHRHHGHARVPRRPYRAVRRGRGPCDDSRHPRSRSRQTSAPARARRRSGRATLPTSTSPSTAITVPRRPCFRTCEARTANVLGPHSRELIPGTSMPGRSPAADFPRRARSIDCEAFP